MTGRTGAAGRMLRAAQEAGERTVEEYSADDEVRVVANLHGRITDLRIRPDVLRTLDREGLSELITRTVQAAQDRAREQYQPLVRAALEDQG